MPDDQVSRRHLLAGLLAASVLSSAGCSSSSAGQPRREPAVLPRVDPDVTARAAAAEAERTLVAAYAATIAAHPALAADLAPFAADHAAHLAAFDDSSPGPATHGNGTASATASPSPGATVSPSPGATVSPSPAPVPDDPVAAVAALLAAEQDAAVRRLDNLAPASPPLARLLASAGAAEAAHAALLGS